MGVLYEKGALKAPFPTIRLKLVSIHSRYFGRHKKNNLCKSDKQDIFYFKLQSYGKNKASTQKRFFISFYNMQLDYLYSFDCYSDSRLFALQKHFAQFSYIDIAYNNSEPITLC